MNLFSWVKAFFLNEDKLRYMRLFVCGCLLVVVFAIVYPYFLKWYTDASAIAEMGQYGDVYGGLNTLFTGLAFVGLVVTILLQRQEMKETREEFEEQTKQFEEQTRLLNEQIEEQKRATEIQVHTALDSQNREELFKRLEMIQRFAQELEVDNAYAEFLAGEWTRVCPKVYRGETAFTALFIMYSDFLAALNSDGNFTSLARMQLKEEQTTMYAALNKLNSWLYSVTDFLRDVPAYFSHRPEVIGVYYRLLFNSMSKNSRSVLLMHAGTTVGRETVQIAVDKKYLLEDNVLPIQVDDCAKILLFKYMNKDVNLDDARAAWKQYLVNSDKKFVMYEYNPRRRNR